MIAAASVLAGGVTCACSNTPTEASDSIPVVEAYLYANEPVRDIRVSATVGVNSDTGATPVASAQATLIRRGVRYKLSLLSAQEGRYGYTGADLVVSIGDTFDLEVTALGRQLSARTVVPVLPTGVSLSKTTITVPSFGGGFGGGNPDFAELVSVARWSNPSRNYYYVVTQNLETNPTAIDRPNLARTFTFPPTRADSFVIAGLAFSYYGRHRIRIFRVNDEYAALYESRQQDSRDLNEPVTNIHNGLGVFSAFSSDTSLIVTVK